MILWSKWWQYMAAYKFCGYSATGKSHEDKGIKCQDSCSCKKGEGFVVAAVADGLSSSKHSDVASRIAVEYSIDYCLQHIKNDNDAESILKIINIAFDESLFSIKQQAGNSPGDFDTTLTLVVFIEGDVYYGQIGDSGIIALREDGKFERVTECQNGEGEGKDRPVYPLAAKQFWIFNYYAQKTKALFLATDGVLKLIELPMLENQEFKLNHKYLSYIYNQLDSKETDTELDSWIKSEISQMAPEDVDFDDKSLVFVSSDKGYLQKQSAEYYEYPSNELWKRLITEYKESLYPYKGSAQTRTKEINQADKSSQREGFEPQKSENNISFNQSIENHSNKSYLFKPSRKIKRKKNWKLILFIQIELLALGIIIIFILLRFKLLW
jgi:serine/threonine protein phosphatase PrpC